MFSGPLSYQVFRETGPSGPNFYQIVQIIRFDVATRQNLGQKIYDLGQYRGPESRSGTWIYLP